MSQALSIVASGMVSAVGLSAPASCAAIRCALDNFQESGSTRKSLSKKSFPCRRPSLAEACRRITRVASFALRSEGGKRMPGRTTGSVMRRLVVST